MSHRLILTDKSGAVIDQWSMDDDLDRDLFVEFSLINFLSDFTAREIKEQLATYDD